jgi:hypothetical protein
MFRMIAQCGLLTCSSIDLLCRADSGRSRLAQPKKPQGLTSEEMQLRQAAREREQVALQRSRVQHRWERLRKQRTLSPLGDQSNRRVDAIGALADVSSRNPVKATLSGAAAHCSAAHVPGLPKAPAATMVASADLHLEPLVPAGLSSDRACKNSVRLPELLRSTPEPCPLAPALPAASAPLAPRDEPGKADPASVNFVAFVPLPCAAIVGREAELANGTRSMPSSAASPRSLLASARANAAARSDASTCAQASVGEPRPLIAGAVATGPCSVTSDRSTGRVPKARRSVTALARRAMQGAMQTVSRMSPVSLRRSRSRPAIRSKPDLEPMAVSDVSSPVARLCVRQPVRADSTVTETAATVPVMSNNSRHVVSAAHFASASESLVPKHSAVCCSASHLRCVQTVLAITSACTCR